MAKAAKPTKKAADAAKKENWGGSKLFIVFDENDEELTQKVFKSARPARVRAQPLKTKKSVKRKKK